MNNSRDVVVVGAGVAGAVAAWRLARRGLSVLLVDKADWPRHKACGGCVNAAALRALAAAGLADVCDAGLPYRAMHLSIGRRQARLRLPAGRAISRERLDAGLVERAIGAGADFAPATYATLADAVPPFRRVRLRSGSRTTTVRARLVLACDGLKSGLLDGRPDVAADSRIGLGAVADTGADYPPGIIHMACGERGYAGLVRVEDGRLNIGAALDPAWVKRRGGAAAAVAALLREAGFPAIDALPDTRWRGTPRLTRRRSRLGAPRVLALGDAAGYVEPFTGEGMAWAVAAAAAIEPFALEAVEHWRDDCVDRWTAACDALIGRRQRACRGVAALLRRPRLAAGVVALADAVPVATTPLTAWLNRDFAPPRRARA